MKTITRSQAIDDLREVLRTLVDDETSLCAAASQCGVFCRGFSRWSLAELRERYPWIAERHPKLDRAGFEELANRWQLCRQGIRSGRLPCDVAPSHVASAPCAGWEQFYEAELGRFHAELCGECVRVVPDWLAEISTSLPRSRRAATSGAGDDGLGERAS